MVATIITKEQVQFLKNHSSQIHDGETTWYYMPFWFKQVGEGEFEIITFEKLPENIIEMIKDLRK